MTSHTPPPAREALKTDAFGSVYVEHDRAPPAVVRDTRAAHAALAWLARRLARREARALAHLAGLERVPALVAFDGRVLVRSYVPGRPMPAGRPATARYYGAALTLLRRMHAAGVAHNDLAKEANWLCMPDGGPAIVDFQIACVMPRRGKWFRVLAREDLRHLLKHKRHYASELLTARERAMLGSPSWPARAWRRLVKPVYLAVTRGLLGWPERVGPEERQRGRSGK